MFYIDMIGHFADFPVTDNVDSCPNLFTHYICYGFRYNCLQGILVYLFASVLFPQHFDQSVRSGQATNMGGKNSISAELQDVYPSVWLHVIQT